MQAEPGTVVTEDVCTPTTLRRVAALLDQDAPPCADGAAMPRGWHVALFAPDPAQSALRPDGYAGIGVPLPDAGLPRLMHGGRRTRFMRDIPVGRPLQRHSRLLSALPKTGRSGRMMVATVRHVIAEAGQADPLLEEEQDFVLLEAGRPHLPPAQADTAPTPGGQAFTTSETLLLRFCALTYNTHRIHFDHPYATGTEGYPALVVNGSLTTLLLTELFRARAGREPSMLTTRTLRPLFCGRTNRLHSAPGEPWRLWAEDEAGALALDATIQ